ncbi:MAG: signal peptidase I [bacterium]|nr:signal peptidase I [bacterium]
MRFFVANPFTVIGESMHPTFEEKDFIVVDKISPRFSEWKRGEVIVFVAPGKTDPYIKRIIAFPGETVKVHDGKVFICSGEKAQNCFVLPEEYLPKGLKTYARCGKDVFKVEGGLFVMGDNRGLTTDSLCCFGLKCYEGTNYVVPENRIIGKVYVRLFPRFHMF